jgi:hypothetical protein
MSVDMGCVLNRVMNFIGAFISYVVSYSLLSKGHYFFGLFLLLAFAASLGEAVIGCKEE